MVFDHLFFLGDICGYNLHGHLKRSPINELLTADDKTVIAASFDTSAKDDIQKCSPSQNVKMIKNDKLSVTSFIARAKQKLSITCAQAKPVHTEIRFAYIPSL